MSIAALFSALHMTSSSKLTHNQILHWEKEETQGYKNGLGNDIDVPMICQDIQIALSPGDALRKVDRADLMKIGV